MKHNVHSYLMRCVNYIKEPDDGVDVSGIVLDDDFSAFFLERYLIRLECNLVKFDKDVVLEVWSEVWGEIKSAG